MTKKENKKEADDYKIQDEDIAKIGNWTQPRKNPLKSDKEEYDEDRVDEEPTTEGEPKEEPTPEEVKEKLKGLTPEQIKERVVKLISEVSSRGLSEEEKTKFIEEFTFWNGTMFELLDISKGLKEIAGQTSFNLTPKQSLLVYLIGTGALVILLRKDLQQKIFKKREDEENN